MRIALKSLMGSLAILFATAAVAIAVNFMRPSGIPLIADIPYDIFSACRDSESSSTAMTAADIDRTRDASVLYVDARTSAEFASGHAERAINVPYSVLFGATPTDLAKVKEAVAKSGALSVVVYGDVAPRENPEARTDLAEPLAAQLVEAGIPGVKHLTGGLDALKLKGVKTVQPGTDRP